MIKANIQRTAAHGSAQLPSGLGPDLSLSQGDWPDFSSGPLFLSAADPSLGAAGREPPSLSQWSAWLKKPAWDVCMGQCVQISAAGGRRGKVETLASWSRRLSSAISLRYLLSRAPSSDTSVTWGSFFIFFAVLANYCKEVTAGGLKCLAVYVLSGSHVKASANFYFTQTLSSV